MRAIFTERAYASIVAETVDNISTETGGLFLGSIVDDTFYIVETIDPGPRSVFDVAYFEYDRDYTQHLINKIARLYSWSHGCIGLWHRHPGSFDRFSGTDDQTNLRYASMREQGAISALVNIDPDFRLTAFHVKNGPHYRRIAIEVGDSLVPHELRNLRKPEDYYQVISIWQAFETIRDAVRRARGPRSLEVSSTEDPSLRELVIQSVIDDLTFIAHLFRNDFSCRWNRGWLGCRLRAQGSPQFDRAWGTLYFAYDLKHRRMVVRIDNEIAWYKPSFIKHAIGTTNPVQ